MIASRASLKGVMRHALGLLFAVLHVQCAQPQVDSKSATPKTASSADWYIASHNPLTYCPKGHQLPQARVNYGPLPTFVYLADRTTRFYIPPGATLHQQQAMKLRKLSMAENQRLPPDVNRTMRWVSRALARTTVTSLVAAATMLVGVPAEDSPAANALETVWENDD